MRHLISYNDIKTVFNLFKHYRVSRITIVVLALQKHANLLNMNIPFFAVYRGYSVHCKSSNPREDQVRETVFRNIFNLTQSITRPRRINVILYFMKV